MYMRSITIYLRIRILTTPECENCLLHCSNTNHTQIFIYGHMDPVCAHVYI